MGKKDKGSSGLLGSVLTLGLGDTVSDHIEKTYEEDKSRLERSDYYEKCPICGRRQLKKHLIEHGCFICGWKSSEVIKIADNGGGREERYRMRCPNCNALLITEQFVVNGCYVCGYRD